MQTNGFFGWERGDIPYGDPVIEALKDELYGRVSTATCNVELTPRVERYIFGTGED